MAPTDPCRRQFLAASARGTLALALVGGSGGLLHRARHAPCGRTALCTTCAARPGCRLVPAAVDDRPQEASRG